MKLKTLAATTLLALSASASFAQDATIPLVLTPSGTGMLGTTFQRTDTGLFIDTFSFSPSTFSGLVAVSLVPVNGPINFFSALLNGNGFSFLPENGTTTFSFQSAVAADQPLILQVFGYAGDALTLTDMAATYGGTITATAVAAVPEPASYGLMLAGLVMMGVSARRSQRRAASAG